MEKIKAVIAFMKSEVAASYASMKRQTIMQNIFTLFLLYALAVLLPAILLIAIMVKLVEKYLPGITG